MPTARTIIDVAGTDVGIEIEFEMWCGVCGAGICGSTKYRKNTDNNFDVECPDCAKAHSAEVQELEEKIAELERDAESYKEVQELEEKIAELERDAESYKDDISKLEQQQANQ